MDDDSRVKYEVLEEKLASRLDSMFSVRNSFVRARPGGWTLPSGYRRDGERVSRLEIRADDVWLVAHPRTGSTWTLEMVWCIVNDLDFKAARSTDLLVRCPLLELTALFGSGKSEMERKIRDAIPDSVGMVEKMGSPRCIRTHLPAQLLPSQISTLKPKIVYVARNPKDVCVSLFHHLSNLHNMRNCSFQEFCKLFLDGKVPVGPYLDHVLGFWSIRDEPNVLFLKYEDMIKDKRAAVNKMAAFLGRPLTEEQVSALLDHSSFDRMRENPAVNLEPIMEQIWPKGHESSEGNKFIRKGKVGDWKNHMSEEVSKRFDKWAEEKLAGTGLEFEYE